MDPLQSAIRDIANEDHLPDQRTWSALRQLNDRHQCQRCGKCCTGQVVGMLGVEAIAIARHMGMSGSDFKAMFIDRQVGKWLMMKKMDSGECMFLHHEDGLAKCIIYAVRPETCRRFPWLTPMIMTGSKWPGVVVDDTLCSQMSTTFRTVTHPDHPPEASGELVTAEYDGVGGGPIDGH